MSVRERARRWFGAAWRQWVRRHIVADDPWPEHDPDWLARDDERVNRAIRRLVTDLYTEIPESTRPDTQKLFLEDLVGTHVVEVDRG